MKRSVPLWSVMIYSDSQEKADKQLERVLEDYDEEVIRRHKNIVITSKRTIRARKFSEYCRGFRYNEVYIDKALSSDKEIVGLITMKMIEPFNDDGTRDSDWHWRDNVHYFDSEEG